MAPLLALSTPRRRMPAEKSIAQFEGAVADELGLPHAVALSSGTAALHLALLALGVGPGDVVLTPTLTFVATSNAILYTGATPFFLDCTKYGVIGPVEVEAAIQQLERMGHKPKAIMAVDLYGHPTPMQDLRVIADQHKVALVQDAAESLGASYGGHPVGHYADICCLSFNANKVVTAQGGGMLLSRNPDLAARARFLANQAREGVGYFHPEVGFNYRMSPLQAKFGIESIQSLEYLVEGRRIVAERYSSLVAPVPGLEMLPAPSWGWSSSWLSVVLLDDTWPSPEAVVQEMRRAGIECRRLFVPNHQLPYLVKSATLPYDCPTATSLYSRGLCLPSSSWMWKKDVRRVVETLRSTARLGVGCVRIA